jgi:hypothetical protein
MSILNRIAESLFGARSTIYKGDFAGVSQRIRIDRNGVIEAETKPGEWRAFHALPRGERAWLVATSWGNRGISELLARWDSNITRIEEMRWKVDGVKLAESHIRTALKDLLRATEPMVADEPATPRDFVELHEARKRAIGALEGQP